jgi:hypothetical protein
MQLGLEPMNEALLNPLLLTEEGDPCHEGALLAVAIFKYGGGVFNEDQKGEILAV